MKAILKRSRVFSYALMVMAVMVCERSVNATISSQNDELSNYAYRYQNPGADIRLVEPIIHLNDAGIVRDVVLSLWVGNAAGDMTVDIVNIESIDIVARTPANKSQSVTMGQAVPLAFSVYAKERGLHNLPINVSLVQRNGRKLMRSLTLVIQVGSSMQRRDGVSVQSEAAKRQYSADGELLKVYSAQESIR